MSRPLRFHRDGTVAVGKALPIASGRFARAGAAPANAFDVGDRACRGCGEALAARCAIDAAMRAAGNQVIAVAATGCLEAIAAPHPEASSPIPWIRSLTGNAAAVASGVAAAMQVKRRTDVRVIAQGGDGATADIGFGCLSAMFERDDDVLYLCYDSEARTRAGVGRPGALPPAERVAMSRARSRPPSAAFGAGRNLPLIAMAHGIPYVATASVADLADLDRKVARATGIRGARYVHVHVPCPPGWGARPEDTCRIARLAVESGLFPLFEAESGEVTARTTIRQRVPVVDYLKPQERFAALFAGDADAAPLAAIQAIADRNIARFRLLA